MGVYRRPFDYAQRSAVVWVFPQISWYIDAEVDAITTTEHAASVGFFPSILLNFDDWEVTTHTAEVGEVDSIITSISTSSGARQRLRAFKLISRA